jgi:hypothetical protein
MRDWLSFQAKSRFFPFTLEMLLNQQSIVHPSAGAKRLGWLSRFRGPSATCDQRYTEQQEKANNQ